MVRKIVIWSLVGLSLVALFIISDFANRNHKYTFLTFPKNYSVMANGEEPTELSLSIYAKEKRSMYLDQECISSVSLSDMVTGDRYTLEKMEIVKHEDLFEYEDDLYQGYDIFAIFPFTVDRMLIIESAALDISYENGEKLSFKVGSFAFSNYLANSEIRISYLRGIIGKMETMPTLGAIVTSIINDSDHSITLHELDFVSSALGVNYDLVTELSEEAALSTSKAQEMLGDYSLSSESIAKQFDITIGSHASKYLLIPLTYERQTFINQVAFEIGYFIEYPDLWKITSPSFRFFNTQQEVIVPERLIYVRD